MINYQDLQGNDGVFNPAHFILMRPTSADFEPENAVHIRLDGEIFDVYTPLTDLVDQLQAISSLFNLTSPNGLDLWIATARILSVSPAPNGLHHPNANALIKLHTSSGPTITRAVQQTVDDVKAML